MCADETHYFSDAARAEAEVLSAKLYSVITESERTPLTLTAAILAVATLYALLLENSAEEHRFKARAAFDAQLSLELERITSTGTTPTRAD